MIGMYRFQKRFQYESVDISLSQRLPVSHKWLVQGIWSTVGRFRSPDISCISAGLAALLHHIAPSWHHDLLTSPFEHAPGELTLGVLEARIMSCASAMQAASLCLLMLLLSG